MWDFEIRVPGVVQDWCLVFWGVVFRGAGNSGPASAESHLKACQREREREGWKERERGVESVCVCVCEKEGGIGQVLGSKGRCRFGVEGSTQKAAVNLPARIPRSVIQGPFH